MFTCQLLRNFFIGKILNVLCLTPEYILDLAFTVELANLRDSEDRMRQQHLESTQREKVLVRRLATKEQEMQEYAVC